jgi:uncharacterized YceG family protein
VSPGRTPEERERARLEREARRAAREGRKPPEPSPPPVEAPAPVEAAAPPQPPAAPPRPPEPDARPPEPPPAFAARPAPRTGRSASERRAAARAFLADRGSRAAGRARRPSGGSAGEGRPGGPSRALIAAVAGGLLSLIAVWFLLSLFQPFKGSGGDAVAVTIPPGAGVSAIGDVLEEKGVISSPFFFRLRASLEGASGDFKAGEFQLREGMGHGAAIDALREPPPSDTVTVTIPEGLARAEIANVVGDALRGDYEAATRRSPVLDPSDYGGRQARDLEGFLFPATYELKPNRPVRELVRRQLVTFKRRMRQVDMRYARRKNLNVYDVLTIASMVEREAQLDKERKLIASVIYNRLKEGIPLGIDATIRFATGNWSEPLKQSELAIDSGYNTRLNQGLPPGPIGNPGLASIEAAARPARTDYLFYVVKPNTCGEHSFSETDAEFQRDVERYNAERAARGGQSPTDCQWR